LSLHARLIELNAGTAEVYYNCGLLAQKLSRNDKAVEFYRKALEQRADFPEALLNLGHVLSAAGREEEARACWAPALELKPELAAGYFRRG
jgi:tetratricopeptide (TPR) repeat protein